MFSKIKIYQRVILLLWLGLSAGELRAATDCNQVTQIPVSECKELLNFYNSTGGDNWWNKGSWNDKNTGGWNQTNTPCSWWGVRCEFPNLVTTENMPCYLNSNGYNSECDNAEGYVTEIGLHHSGSKSSRAPPGNNLI